MRQRSVSVPATIPLVVLLFAAACSTGSGGVPGNGDGNPGGTAADPGGGTAGNNNAGANPGGGANGGNNPNGGGNPGAGNPGGGASQRWLTGYYPSYRQFTMPPAEIDYSAFTHLIHWPVLPVANGSLDTASTDFTAAHSADVVTRAHQAGIVVLLGVGGDATSGATAGFQGATQPATRATFVANIVALMQSRGYDGVDINWEEITPADDTAFVAFFAELRSALDAIAPRPLLTMPPTTGSSARPDLVAQIASALDQINLQTYVMSGPYPGWVTWFNSPIANGGAEFPSVPGERLPSIEDEVQRFTDAGIAPAKLAIGIQFDGFVWAGGSGTDTGGATRPRQGWVTPPVLSTMPYAEIVTTLTAAAGYQPGFDLTAREPYLSRDSANDADDRFVSFDDAQAIAEKANYLSSARLGGAFVFEISGDYLPSRPAGQRHPLLDASRQFLLDGFVRMP
ncbi:MAG TPA: glycoside hydrolase family 18 protein [Planctomycetota bacterium]|nr:glycoside hydrolase family 18 protein [Planctomycetota bacterium]